MRNAIRSAQMTNKEVAEKLGVSQDSITNYTKGITSPSIDFLIDFCKLVGADLSEIVRGPIPDFEEKENKPMVIAPHPKKRNLALSDDEGGERKIILEKDSYEKLERFIRERDQMRTGQIVNSEVTPVDNRDVVEIIKKIIIQLDERELYVLQYEIEMAFHRKKNTSGG